MVNKFYFQPHGNLDARRLEHKYDKNYYIVYSLRRVDDSIEYYAEFAKVAEELDDYDAVKRACNETGYLYNIIVSIELNHAVPIVLYRIPLPVLNRL
jgi:hypothetical protein